MWCASSTITIKREKTWPIGSGNGFRDTELLPPAKSYKLISSFKIYLLPFSKAGRWRWCRLRYNSDRTRRPRVRQQVFFPVPCTVFFSLLHARLPIGRLRRHVTLRGAKRFSERKHATFLLLVSWCLLSVFVDSFMPPVAAMTAKVNRNEKRRVCPVLPQIFLTCYNQSFYSIAD